MIIALCIASSVVDSSPFSTSGALVVANSPEDRRDFVYKRLMQWGMSMIIIAPVTAWAIFVLPGWLRVTRQRSWGMARARPTRERVQPRAQEAGRLGRRDAEAEALLQVEVDGFGVVVVVADREVLAGLEQEVAAAQADDDRAAHAGRPHDRAAARIFLRWSNSG